MHIYLSSEFQTCLLGFETCLSEKTTTLSNTLLALPLPGRLTLARDSSLGDLIGFPPSCERRAYVSGFQRRRESSPIEQNGASRNAQDGLVATTLPKLR